MSLSLKRNTIWNLIGTGLPLVMGVFTIPYLVRHLGVEAFGILTLVWTLIGYFSLFDFGLGRALTQQVASSLAHRDQASISAIVKSGFLFTLMTGLVGGLVLAAVAHPLAYTILKVAETLQHDTTICLLLAAFGIPLTTLTTGVRGVLEAYEDFKSINVLRIVLGVANFGLPALSIFLGYTSLAAIVATLIAARVVVLLLHFQLLPSKLGNHGLTGQISFARIKTLLSFGAWMTVSNIISPLMVTADRFIVAAILGAGMVAYYTVPFEMLIRLLILPGALTAALFPRLTALIRVDKAMATILYKKSLKMIGMVMLPCCLVVAALSYWGLFVWLGVEFAEKGWMIVVILSIGIFFNAIAHVPFAAVQAAGNSKKTAQFHLIEFVIYLPLLFVTLHLFGLLGAAIAWTMRVSIDAVLLLFYARKNIGLV
jgi:O-antigen/teichoic acid export membrane protein